MSDSHAYPVRRYQVHYGQRSLGHLSGYVVTDAGDPPKGACPEGPVMFGSDNKSECVAKADELNAAAETSEPTGRGRVCFIIVSGQRNERGYIPSAVEEDVAGHSPLIGKGEFSEPWYWGETWEEATEVCAKANAKLGLTPDDVEAITASSIAAQLRSDARRDEAEARLRRLGLRYPTDRIRID